MQVQSLYYVAHLIGHAILPFQVFKNSSFIFHATHAGAQFFLRHELIHLGWNNARPLGTMSQNICSGHSPAVNAQVAPGQGSQLKQLEMVAIQNTIGLSVDLIALHYML